MYSMKFTKKVHYKFCRYCGSCLGAEGLNGVDRCTNCRVQTPDGASCCMSCKAYIRENDRFCRECGMRIEVPEPDDVPSTVLVVEEATQQHPDN